jgi:TfoX/Sxy family transcriptional regulator of competence genes
LAYEANAVDRVRRVLARRRGIAERKMMGALCFMANGKMCCGITGSALMVRVDADAGERLVGKPHIRPLEFAGRRARGFVLIDPPAYRSDTALANWVRQALDFAARLPTKRSARRKFAMRARD